MPKYQRKPKTNDNVRNDKSLKKLDDSKRGCGKIAPM